jgi:hypothetical protein
LPGQDLATPGIDDMLGTRIFDGLSRDSEKEPEILVETSWNPTVPTSETFWLTGTFL